MKSLTLKGYICEDDESYYIGKCETGKGNNTHIGEIYEFVRLNVPMENFRSKAPYKITIEPHWEYVNESV